MIIASEVASVRPVFRADHPVFRGIITCPGADGAERSARDTVVFLGRFNVQPFKEPRPLASFKLPALFTQDIHWIDDEARKPHNRHFAPGGHPPVPSSPRTRSPVIFD
jgi:hypothetical protein